MRIEVKSAEVQAREVLGKGGREGFTAYSQVAYVVSEDERKKISLRVPDRNSGYKPGAYELAADSFVVNSFGGLELARVVLQPVKG